MSTVHFKVTNKQREFLESTSWGTIFLSGVGGGKSLILCVKSIVNALRGRRQLIVSFSYPVLRDVILTTMLKVLDMLCLKQGEDWILNRTEMSIRIRGTEILMRSGDNPDSLRGLNISDVFIDEAREFHDRKLFDILIGRIREEKDSSWSICTTPNGRDWVYHLSMSDNVKLITQTTMENTFLPQSYIQHLVETYSGVFADQEIYGKVVDFVGEVIDPSTFRMISPLSVSEGIRYYDLAFADKKKSDWTVGALCLISGVHFTIADIVRVKAKYPDLKELIVRNALADGTGVKIGLEDVAAQRAVVDDLARDKRLMNYVIVAQRPIGTKLARAMPWISRAKLGEVQVVNSHWTQEFFAECAAFRADMTHPHDDMIDAVSGAWHTLMSSQTARTARIRI